MTIKNSQPSQKTHAAKYKVKAAQHGPLKR